MDLSVIVACFNEGAHLRQSMEELFKVLDNTRFTYEVIFVDDSSQDNTRELIDEIILAYRDKKIKKIFHECNTGRGGAITDGFRIAEGEIAGYLDIDLEVHVRYIPSCVLAIKDGFDVAVVSRVYKFHWKSVNRYLMSRGYLYLVRKFLKLPFSDTETGFKFFRRDKLMPIIERIEDKGWFWDTEFMANAYRYGMKIAEIPGLYLRRPERLSTVNSLYDSIAYFIKLIRFSKLFKTNESIAGNRD
jgi:glycosyltransferase involved in cell wall biosynthesis